MLSMRAKSLPLLASMAAIYVTAPAFAQDVKVASSEVDRNMLSSKLQACDDKYGPSQPTAGGKCYINAVESETARLKREGDAADVRAAAADAAADCIKYLTAGVRSGAFDKAQIVQKAGGKLNVSNACPIAKDYGFGKKAEVSPSLN